MDPFLKKNTRVITKKSPHKKKTSLSVFVPPRSVTLYAPGREKLWWVKHEIRESTNRARSVALCRLRRASTASVQSVNIIDSNEIVMNSVRTLNNNENNAIFSSLFSDGGENSSSNKLTTKKSYNRAQQQNRGVLGNITNNSNSYDNKRNNTSNNATTKGGNFAKTTSSAEQINNSIQSLKRDVERLALQESHEFESKGRGADTINNNEDRIILGKIMEELIVEYSEREQPHSYYYRTLREASSRANSEKDDMCRFNF